MKSTLVASLLAAAALTGCGIGSDDEAAEQEVEVPFSTAEWATDFSTNSVPLDEFVGGGPPKDGIPSIDVPKFVGVDEAEEFLDGSEPVAVVELEGEIRAYPLQILIWHEIVNDEIAGEPVAVTYCPLCNSTVAFRREVDGRPVEFGTTGMLRNSDLVMYDRATESWWQQITAEAVVGELTGTKLEVLPSQILAWDQFQRLHPGGRVLSRETGFDRNYGSNPYTGYDSDPTPSRFCSRARPTPRCLRRSGWRRSRRVTVPLSSTRSPGSPTRRRSTTRSTAGLWPSSSTPTSPRPLTAPRSPPGATSAPRRSSSASRARERSTSRRGRTRELSATSRPHRPGP